MRITEEILMAYADGEADAPTRAAVEAAMAADGGVRDRVEAHRRLRGTVAGAFGAAITEPVPERLIAAARGEASTPRPARPAEIVNLAAVRALKAAPKGEPPKRRAWVQWGALAACVAIGVIGARGLGSVGTSAVIGDRRGALMAEGALSQALNQQIAGSQTGGPAADKAIRIGVSFRSNDKLYCRTFQVARGDGLAGVACRAPTGWQVRATAVSPSPETATNGYRTAASALPAGISATVDAMIDGAPLDAQAEAAAKAKGWRDYGARTWRP